MSQKCQFIKSNNKQCNAWAMTGSKYCFRHNPDTQNKSMRASIKGGKYKADTNYKKLKPIKINEPQDILLLLKDTINRVRKVNSKGIMDIKTANCIGFLASKILETQEKAILNQRINKLQELLEEKGIINDKQHKVRSSL